MRFLELPASLSESNGRARQRASFESPRLNVRSRSWRAGAAPENVPPSQSDNDLLGRLAQGDQAALGALYERWKGPMYRFALRMSGRVEVAEDVTQELFLALLRAAPRYDPGAGPLAPYLYGIARNLLLRRLERERAFVALPEDVPAQGEGVTGELARQQTVRVLHRAVQALPAHYREAVVLCDLEGLSYVEAASALGCAVGTVRSRLHRARALLCERLREAPARAPALPQTESAG